MLQVLQTYEWFKEVLKCMSTFEPIQIKQIFNTKKDNIQLYINRKQRDKITLIASYFEKDENNKDTTYTELFKFVIFYNCTDTVTLPANISFIDRTYRFTYSDQFKSQIRLKDVIYDDNGNDISTRVVLDYPLREEQIFQQLTLMYIPEQEYIERYVQASKEIISELSEDCIITFRSLNDYNQINETNHEIMVQSVMDCMKELMQLETERKNGLVLKA